MALTGLELLAAQILYQWMKEVNPDVIAEIFKSIVHGTPVQLDVHARPIEDLKKEVDEESRER